MEQSGMRRNFFDRRRLRKRNLVLCCIAAVLLAFTFITIGLVFSVNSPGFAVVHAQLMPNAVFTTADNNLAAGFTFTVRTKNPNRIAAIYYKRADATLSFGHTQVAAAALSATPFRVSSRDATNLPLFFQVNGAVLDPAAAMDFNSSIWSVAIKATFRGVIGDLKTNYRELNVACKFNGWFESGKIHCN